LLRLKRSANKEMVMNDEQMLRVEKMQMKARAAIAVGLIVEAARQSGMLQRLAEVLC
jgi:hypothetical protein